MLAAILERTGKSDELAALLSRQIDSAKDRGDAASIASLALRLGRLLEQRDRAEARNVYYTGLDWEAGSQISSRPCSACSTPPRTRANAPT